MPSVWSGSLIVGKFESRKGKFVLILALAVAMRQQESAAIVKGLASGWHLVNAVSHERTASRDSSTPKIPVAPDL